MKGLIQPHDFSNLYFEEKEGISSVPQNGGHSIAPTPQAPVRKRQTKKVANAKVRIG